MAAREPEAGTGADGAVLPGFEARPPLRVGGDEDLPRHDLRLSDERARLGADEGDARVARLPRGRRPRPGRPDPVQHLLDPREGRRALHRPPRRGQAGEVRAPGCRRRGRRLLGAVGQGGGVRALPVRRRGVRPRPGAQAGRVSDQRLADRAGLLRVRGLHRAPARQARARVPGMGADQRRLQLRLLVLHRALHARAARSRRPPARAGGRGRAARRRRRPRGDAARAERQLLRPRSAARRASELRRSCWRWSTRSTGSSESATRARTPRTCART